MKKFSEWISVPWKRNMGIICNVCGLEEITAENDRGIPPVQTLCRLFEKHRCQIENLTDFDDICIGELMAFLFKHILGYQNQKDNVPVQNNFEIKTAAVYFTGRMSMLEQFFSIKYVGRGALFEGLS